MEKDEGGGGRDLTEVLYRRLHGVTEKDLD
jgi:hypothetical protein